MIASPSKPLLRPKTLLAACAAAFVLVPVWKVDSQSLMATSKDWQSANIHSAVPGHPGTSYVDLLMQVISDLAENDSTPPGPSREPFPHIVDGYGGDLPDRIAINSLQVVNFMVAGEPRIAILANIGQLETAVEQPALLSIFDGGKSLKLIDAVDVGMDRDTSFARPALVNIGRSTQALVIRSSHFNSSESFETTVLIFLRGRELELVDTFSTYHIRTCNEQKTQVVDFTEISADDVGTYSDILVTIEERRSDLEENCSDEVVTMPNAEVVSVVYRWNAELGDFIAASDTLERFEARAAKRMSDF